MIGDESGASTPPAISLPQPPQAAAVRNIVVTALHQYVSNNESIISFEEGDVIQVLTRLPSGWWYGVCKGQRGWFPSNFVSAPSSMPEPTVEPSTPATPSTPGYAQIYQDFRNSTASQARRSTDASTSPGGVHSRSSRSVQASVQGYSRGKKLMIVPPMRILAESAIQLPPNWGMKVTPDGRVYYYNMVTNETRWNIGDEPQNTASQSAEDAAAVAATETAEGILDAVKEPEWTWPGLSNQIIVYIHELTDAIKAGRKELLVPTASAIFEAIRVMLYASGTSKPNSPAIAANKSLKQYYKQLLTSIPKLVVAAKTASGVWPPPDAIALLTQYNNDVLVAVRHFSSTAQELSVPIHPIETSTPITPSIHTTESGASTVAKSEETAVSESEGSLTTRIAQHQEDDSYIAPTNAELLLMLESSLRTTIGLVAELSNPDRMQALHAKAAESGTSIRDVMSASVRPIVQEVGHFIELVDELPIKTLSDDLMVDYKVNYQDLVNSITGLVSSAVGTMSGTSLNAFQEIANTAMLVEKAVKDLLISTKFLIEEKESSEQLALQTYIEYGNQPGSRPVSGEFRHRRAMSMTLAVQGEDRSSMPPQFFFFFFFFFPTEQFNGPVSAGATPVGLTGDWDGETFSMSRRSSKLRQILSEDVAPIVRPKRDVPWYLQCDYGPNDMILNQEGQIRGGTIQALTEKLTLHDSVDANFTLRFLLTYKSFTNSTSLFHLLEKRFLIQQPAGLTSSQVKEWTDQKLTPIRLRVFNVLKSWVEHYMGDEPDDNKALELIRNFAEKTMSQYMAAASAQLLRVVDRRIENGSSSTSSGRLATIPSTREMPPAILPKNIKKFKFTDLDPLEIARQLTIKESELFSAIQPAEFLDKSWSKKDKPNVAVNVKKLALLSNQVAGWTAATILGEPDLRKRGKTLAHFISVAEKCASLNNYSGLMSILGTIGSAHIHRLRKTWDLVPPRQLVTYETLREIMSPMRNFANYRNALRSVNPPCVPFLGCYLTDLTFLDDANPDTIKGRDNMINFGKMGKIADVLREVQQFQHIKYVLIKVQEIQDFLDSVLVVDASDTEFYDISLQLEPRE
eukprot:jgi/Hompol1/7002/HPOL_005160-RA